MTIRDFLRSTFRENNQWGCLLLVVVAIILMFVIALIFPQWLRL
jgi:hypothetical protein